MKISSLKIFFGFRKLIPAFIFACLLGCMAFTPQPSSRHEMVVEMTRLAASGDSAAIFQLARMTETGFDTIAPDSIKSHDLYMESARRGYTPAMNYIGFSYYSGSLGTKNLDSAMYWIRKAAENGDITAAANLGYLLLDSPDFPHDEEEAIRWLFKASVAGVPETQSRLVGLLSDQWRQLSPDSALNLGIKYYTDKAPVLGVAFFQIAADAGKPKAMALLGDAYSKGLGVPYDHQKSIDYFYRAAMAGDPSARFILAELLEFFPDALSSLSSMSPQDSIPDPRALYQQASFAGINDSDSAFSRLLSP